MPEPLLASAPARGGRRRPPGAEIAGLGVSVPETVVGNAPIAARLGVEEDWIVQRTGVEERRVAAPGETVADYATRAGERALAAAAVDAAELDLVVVATVSNEELTPAASPRVAAALGAVGAGALDVNAACTGFVAALLLAAGQIEAGRAATVLVVGADLMSRLTDRDDRSTAALFGDGAGAVLLRGASPARIGPGVLGADGGNADLIVASREEAVIRMQGHETFRHAVERVTEASLAAAAAADTGLDEIDLFVYHQANARILRAVGERLELPAERVVDCIGRYGNASAATVPLALEEARREGSLSGGEKVLLAAFGAGLTWGATVIEWGGGAGGA